MTRISKRGKKILTMVLALVLVAELFPNTALFEGWNVVAWATGTELYVDDFMVVVDTQEGVGDTVSYTYNGAKHNVEVSSTIWTEADDYTWQIVKNGAVVTEVKDAGSYEVRVYPVDGTTTVADSNGYLVLKKVTVTQFDFNSNSGIFTIEDILYTGESLTPEITVNTSYSFLSESDYMIDTYSKDGSVVTTVSDEGSYEATIEAQGSNCTGSTMITFNVKKVSLKDCDIEVASTAEYTGEEQKPAVTVTYGSTTLAEGTDYTVTYDGNADWTNAGADKKITITGQGSYKDTVEKSFEITQKALSDSNIEVHYVLGKSDISVSIKDGSNALTEGTDYTVTSAGVYTEESFGQEITDLSSISSVDYPYYYRIEASGTNYTINASVRFEAEYENEVEVENGNNRINPNSVLEPGSLFAIEGTSISPYYRGSLTVSLTGSNYYISTTIAGLSNHWTQVENIERGADIYIQNVTTGAISCYKVDTAYIKDSDDPTITTDNISTDWTSTTKSITGITAVDDTSGILDNTIYYYVGEDILGNSGVTSISGSSDLDQYGLTTVTGTEADPDNAKKVMNGSIADSNDEDTDGTVYYIYAFDGAGNLTTKEVTVSKVDTIAPTVSMSYPDGQDGSDSSSNYFYQPADTTSYYEAVTLVYTEKNYAVADYPTISYSTDGGSTYEGISATVTAAPSASFTSPLVQWEPDSSSGTLTATVYLPYSSGAEVAYKLKTSYADVVGNKQVLASGADANLSGSEGEYTGIYTIVLDDCAPVLTSFSIDGLNTKYLSDGTIVAYAKISNTGSALTWSIDDNDSYWDKTAVTVTIYKKVAGQSGFESYQTVDDSAITWTDRGSREHSAEYSFTGDTDGAATYYVAISYQDRAKNAMTKDAGVTEGACAYGTYESAEFILDYGTDSNVSTQTTVQAFSELPEGLKSLYSSVDELISDLISRVTVGTGYTADNALVYDVVLQYSTDGGKTWITATVDNFPADGITVTLPYPDGTDASYEFTVLHMFTVDSDRLGITAGDTESPTVTKTDDGLVFTLTGLSPVAVSWKAVTTSTTETDTSSQTDTTTESTDTSGTSASSTTSAQTGDNSPVALWLVLLSVSGAGLLGAAVYSRKRKYNR